MPYQAGDKNQFWCYDLRKIKGMRFTFRNAPGFYISYGKQAAPNYCVWLAPEPYRWNFD